MTAEKSREPWYMSDRRLAVFMLSLIAVCVAAGVATSWLVGL